MNVQSSYKMSIKYALNSSQQNDYQSKESCEEKKKSKDISIENLDNSMALDQEYDSLIEDDSQFHDKKLLENTIDDKEKPNPPDNENSNDTTENESNQNTTLGLQNFLQVRIQSDIEKVDEIFDNWPLLEFRKACLRILKGFSEMFRIIVQSILFQFVVILVIFFNTAMLAVENPMYPVPDLYRQIDLFFVYFYTAEFAIRVFANGIYKNADSYFRD